MRTVFLTAVLALAALPATTADAAIAEVAIGMEAEPTSEDLWRDHLTAQRRLQIERLRAYADAGIFPRNTSTDGLLSILLDDEGRPCAMAHLIRISGHEDLIDALSKKDNAAQLGAFKRGAVNDWILASGLTHEEVAYVQVPDFRVDWEHPRIDEILVTEDARLKAHFLAAADQLELNFDASIEEALDRLGRRVRRAPPV